MELGALTLLKYDQPFRKVRVYKLAKRLGIRSQSLIGLLRQAGFVLPSSYGDFALNEDQLKIISHAYVKSVKSLFRKTEKTYHLLPSKKQSLFYSYFQSFISEPSNYNEANFYFADLDDVLIEKHFYYLVATSDYGSSGSIDSYRSYVIRLSIILTSIFAEIHKKTISIFIKNHFYNFSVDEDFQSGKRTCFS